MLRSLIKKEMREHLFVAAGGLLASLALVAVFMRAPEQLRPLQYIPYPLPVGLATNQFAGWHTALCCILGLVLGALMTWKESAKKTWHFLIHRPVEKRRILQAKLLAGTLLYLSALAVPYAFLAVWSAVPGHFPAPFTIDYLFPGLESLVRGLGIFYAAFLCGVYEAKWTRVLP